MILRPASAGSPVISNGAEVRTNQKASASVPRRLPHRAAGSAFKETLSNKNRPPGEPLAGTRQRSVAGGPNMSNSCQPVTLLQVAPFTSTSNPLSAQNLTNPLPAGLNQISPPKPIRTASVPSAPSPTRVGRPITGPAAEKAMRSLSSAYLLPPDCLGTGLDTHLPLLPDPFHDRCAINNSFCQTNRGASTCGQSRGQEQRPPPPVGHGSSTNWFQGRKSPDRWLPRGTNCWQIKHPRHPTPVLSPRLSSLVLTLVRPPHPRLPWRKLFPAACSGLGRSKA